MREKAIAVEINELSKNSANVQAQLEALNKNLKALEATGHDALQVQLAGLVNKYAGLEVKGRE